VLREADDDLTEITAIRHQAAVRLHSQPPQVELMATTSGPRI
jgi:hypothetical protein